MSTRFFHLFCAAAVTTVAIGSTAHANHTETFSDFDTFTDAGWFPVPLGTNPFYSGGNFLSGAAGGDFLSLGILDPLPTGDGGDEFGDRLVTLSFDFLTIGADWGGVATGSQLEVLGNGDSLFAATFASFGGALQSYPDTTGNGVSPATTGATFVAGDLAVYHIELMFPLLEGDGSGMSIDFMTSGALVGTWGLDNVAVDWSQPLPAPGGLTLVGVGLVMGGRRRR